MPSRWHTDDKPLSLPAFLRRFPDDAACARYLFEKRWPDGFVCPVCGGQKGWELAAKRWAMGTYHGLRQKHLDRYLGEFVFRWNRRRWRHVAFDKLLGLSVRLPPMGYRELVTG